MIFNNLYHTQEYRLPLLKMPIEARGNKQWLGDGYYFWQDIKFAKWWGDTKKCNHSNISRVYSVYQATITCNEDDFIDTVFNEIDYLNFVKTIEKFAAAFTRQFKKKPSLIEFNDFIYDMNLWQNIKVIRFQDLPENNDLVEVNGFYYKKRIQFRVNNLDNITNFVHIKNFACI